ncbi:MAG: glutamate 5-kinase [Desulfuromonadaceae bacterium]|nr:glutamate 5-kinase [Geobacteraceae bacterium]
MREHLLAPVKRVVIKIGSGVITTPDGLNFAQVQRLSEAMCRLHKQGYEVIVVSSGSVAAGKGDLGISGRPQSIPLKQAAAAVGQSRLMRSYRSVFRSNEENVAQILLTRDDLSNRRRYLNARNTIMTLLDYGIVPIINENDTVVVDEIRFGDNDNLSSMVASLVEANLLLILSDVDGLFDKDPGKYPDASLLHEVEHITPEIEVMAGESASTSGTGGMATKLKAAKRATRYGIATAIINGLKPENLSRFFAGEDIGTFFLPTATPMASKKHWIAFTKKVRGRIIIDAGACRAILDKGKSLLPSGIIAVEGGFDRGDSVCLCDENGDEFARGITNYTQQEIIQIRGHKSAEITGILGYKYSDEIVHRDNLVFAREDD